MAQLQKVNRALYEIIPIEFLGHIQVAGYPQNGALHIYADSPAWATKLRFYKSTIAAGLTLHTGLPVKSVQISIHPQIGGRDRPPPKKPSFSRNSAQLLAVLAKNTADPELKRALS
ncbi:MAG TPA: DciA family protein, partial [Gammaproteobacteria bacterium]